MVRSCPPEGPGAYPEVRASHKQSAQDGYSHQTRQVAALDSRDLGHTYLTDHYSQRGESPGMWLGSAFSDVDLRPRGRGDGPADDIPIRRGQAPECGRIDAGVNRPPRRRERITATGARRGQPRPAVQGGDTASEFRSRSAAALGIQTSSPLAARIAC